MNTMTAKALTRDYFDAMQAAGVFDAYSRDDVMEWTMDVFAEIMDGDLTSDGVYAEIASLDD